MPGSFTRAVVAPPERSSLSPPVSPLSCRSWPSTPSSDGALSTTGRSGTGAGRALSGTVWPGSTGTAEGGAGWLSGTSRGGPGGLSGLIPNRRSKQFWACAGGGTSISAAATAAGSRRLRVGRIGLRGGDGIAGPIGPVTKR